MPPPPPPSGDLLLEHGAFLRRLARRLLRDEDAVEDVVQEACLAALTQPAPTRAPRRAWLTGVVRNLVRRRHRTTARLRRREALAARPEATDLTPAAVAARLEIQRRVAREVAELPEPGRTAVLLRYYDDLAPAAIAQRLGVPVRTVESRLRRARETLRARLDATARGGRAGWHAALAPFAAPLVPSAPASTAAGALATTSGTSASAAWGTGAVLAGAAAMTTKTLLLAAAVSAVGAFALGRVTAPKAAPVPDEASRGAADDGAEEAVRLPPGAPELQAARRELADATRLAGELRAERDRLEARLVEAGIPLEGELPHRAAATTASATATPETFVTAGLEEALGSVEWAAAGESIARMAPLLEKFAEALLAGEGLPPEVGEVQRWNGPLITAALRLQQKGTPGSGVNGAFTHPSVTVNLVQSALAAAGLPLDERQIDLLHQIGTRYADEDARRRAGYPEGTLQLRKIMDEAALKDRLYAEIDGILTVQQREALHPEAIRGRLGADLFSSGILLSQFVHPIQHEGRADLVQATVAFARAEESGMRTVPSDILTEAATTWAGGFSDEFLATTADGFAPYRMFRLEIVKDAAARTLALYEDLVRTLPTGSPAIEAVRSSPFILFPLHK